MDIRIVEREILLADALNPFYTEHGSVKLVKCL